MNRCKDGVRVDSRASTTSVGSDERARRVPVALQETQNLVRLSRVTADVTLLANRIRQRDTLAKRTVLYSSREKGRGVHLLPQVEASYTSKRARLSVRGNAG